MPKDISYYVGLGMDEGTARYFVGGRPRPISVEPGDDKSLLIVFENGEGRKYDVAPLIDDGSVFSFLKDSDAFSRAYIDSDGSIAWDKDPCIDSDVVWSNKVDISPDRCYVDGIPVTV